MTGPRARRIASRGCAPAQARRTRRCHAVADQPAVLAHRTASPACVGLAALSWWLLAASLAPVCVKCHHAGCVIPLPPPAAAREMGDAGGTGGTGQPEAGSLRPGHASRAAPPSHQGSVPWSRSGGTAGDQSPARRTGAPITAAVTLLAGCADHAACVTPAHPVRQ